MHILFVCSGNTCRSPMAQALFMQLIQNSSQTSTREIAAQSAGLYAAPGSPASYEAIEVMAELGIDLSRHHAQALDKNLLQRADLILTMTMDHYRKIIKDYDIPAAKIFTLAEFSQGKHIDIIDPFASSLQTYRQCAQQIKGMIETIIKKIS